MVLELPAPLSYGHKPKYMVQDGWSILQVHLVSVLAEAWYKLVRRDWTSAK